MNEHFVQAVVDMAPALRKRSFRQLGMSPLVEHLSSLLNKYLTQPIQECSPVLIGEAFVTVMTKAIEGMKPEEGEGDTPMRRRFLYLYEYLIKGKERRIVEESLGISRSLFYEIQQEALENLSVVIWELEMKEENNMSRNILHNLIRPPYAKFIERYDSQGKNYIDDIIIPELRDGRAWIVALTGTAGVGKSSLAYATAEKVSQSPKKLLLPFEAVIWISFRQGEPQPGRDIFERVTNMASMASVFDVIGSALGNRGVFKSTLEEKKRIIDELIRDRVCLFILDNLDSEWILDKSFMRDLENFVQSLPRPHKALVTFRNDQNWQGQYPIKITNMTIQEAKNFLLDEADLRRQMPFSDVELNKVLQKTYGVPLAMRWVLGLTRVYGYTIEEALDFEAHGKEMLRFMYEKAYHRLPLPAKKLLLAIPYFIDLAFPEPLEYICSVTGSEQVEQLGRLYRGHLIESTLVEETQEYGYSLLPFVREFLGQIKADPESCIDNISVQDFLDQAYNRMPDYYIERLNACRGQKESVLLILKYEKHNIIKSMERCWELHDARFVEILNLIGSYLGTLHYLLEREKWGRRSFEFLRKLGRYEEANWHLIYDVAWTLTRKGTMKEREEGRVIFESALEEARYNNWGKNIALALTNLGRMMISDGNLEKAREYLNESNLLLIELKEDSWINLYHRAMADLMQNQGELDEAIKIYLLLKKNYIMNGDINGQVETLSSLALTLAKVDHCEEALQIAEESVKLAEQISPPAYSRAFALSKMAETKVLCGQIHEAISDSRKSQDIYSALGMTYQVSQMKEMINDLQSSSGKSDKTNAIIDETEN